jgi:hypothetical protein
MEDWKQRCRDAGLKQVVLARLVGQTPTTISLQLQGKSRLMPHVQSAILAWEIMDHNQRHEWVCRCSD